MRRKTKVENISRMEMENSTMTRLVDTIPDEDHLKTIGILLAGIFARQGQMLEIFREMEANSWRR